MDDDLRSRRTVFATVGAGGLALTLTACGGSTDTAQPAGTAGSSAPESSAPESSAPESSAPQAGGALGSTADVPVGGGMVFKDQKIVVTQPTSGEFKAFSAVCTHKGCTVGDVADGTINCPCHGSKFGIADGAVAGGPAEKPLPEQQITVEGDQIMLA
ncbi:Rieske (2Fe-2S) protein [Nonomuraea sp. K274]|uniref:Cytochrome bc1 complex Rieske iron-sulfur subunit n=1 Tax=Nonomuraea cypriaca TaxID=1187855 RepID=A0A931AB38_9ACTN|nr:Rieske (2Fe-2S) protein [Nonomuraea cypriaca]MBF8189556.1 Rieske (2Fe-2S) protein [Nonomuraea cypriaca]